MGAVYPDAGRRGDDQCGDLPRQLQRHDDLLRTHAGRAHFYLGLILFAVGALDRLFHLLRHACGRQAGESYDGSIRW